MFYAPAGAELEFQSGMSFLSLRHSGIGCLRATELRCHSTGFRDDYLRIFLVSKTLKKIIIKYFHLNACVYSHSQTLFFFFFIYVDPRARFCEHYKVLKRCSRNHNGNFCREGLVIWCNRSTTRDAVNFSAICFCILFIFCRILERNHVLLCCPFLTQDWIPPSLRRRK